MSDGDGYGDSTGIKSLIDIDNGYVGRTISDDIDNDAIKVKLNKLIVNGYLEAG